MRSWRDKSRWRSSSLLIWLGTSPAETDCAIDCRIRDNNSLLLAKVLCLKKGQEGKALAVQFRSIRNREVSDRPLRQGPKQHHKLDNLNRIISPMTQETSILTQLDSQVRDISKLHLWEDHMGERRIRGLRIDCVITGVGPKVTGVAIRRISPKADLLSSRLSLHNRCLRQAYTIPDSNLRCLRSPTITTTTAHH